MGKRELLLIAAFVVLGVVVYQVTAPTPAAGTEGASFHAIWRNLQRHIKGNQATATLDSTQSAPADGIGEMRVSVPRSVTLKVTGEERSDVSAELHVVARGFDDSEARANASATRVKLDRRGTAIVITPDVAALLTAPRSAPAAQLTLTIHVPQRLGLRVDTHAGTIAVSNVASIDLALSRGQTDVSSIHGQAILSTIGAVTIDGCDELKLTARGGRGTIRNIGGAASVNVVGGELQILAVTGPLEIVSRSAALTLAGLDRLNGPFHVDAADGTLDIQGLRTETRIEARNTRLDVAMAAAAPVTIESTGDDIRITPPAAGYSLDAVATDGRITMADAALRPTVSDTEQRASGPVRGGGPTMALRATRANIEVRAHTK